MAEESPRNQRNQSEGNLYTLTKYTNNYYFSGATELTTVNAGPGNKTFANTKTRDDSFTHVGDVYGTPQSVVDPLTTLNQSSRLRRQSYSALSTITQLSLHSTSETNSDPPPKLGESLPEAKQFLLNLRPGHSSTQSIAGSSESAEVEEDHCANEEEELEKERDEVSEEEEDEYSGPLSSIMAERSQTIIEDNQTVIYGGPLRYSMHNSYHGPGRVITISGDEGQLAYRTMVVMANSDEHALQCVSLCPHPHMIRSDYKHYSKSHVPVCARTGVNTTVATEFKKRIFIEFTSDSTNLMDGCFINCQHLWSVSSNKVKYAEVGQVRNFQDLLKTFSEIQGNLYKPIKVEFGLQG